MIRPSMHYVIFVLLFSFCYNDAQGQSKEVRMFIFGHSLLDHRPPSIPTPSDETTIPHWLALLAKSAGYDYAATGQYGFIPQHANLPPIAQWGYDVVTPVWDSDIESFEDAQFNSILFTVGNFVQWQPVNAPYPGENGETIISFSETILDFIQNNTIEGRSYIYENWPDMAPYLSSGFPPSTAEMQNYHHYTLNDFHDWWLDYQNQLLETKPASRVKMIPVGPILSELVESDLLNGISAEEWYEDDAPHGRANLYFLASLITYSAVYEEIVPQDFTIPNLIHNEIKSNFEFITQYIWNYLKEFNHPNGESRVFYNDLPTKTGEYFNQNDYTIFPNPASDFIEVLGHQEGMEYHVYDKMGHFIFNTAQQPIHIEYLSEGMYFLKICEEKGECALRKVVKVE